MTKYTARISDHSAMSDVVEGLRGVGSVELLFTCEYPSRREAIRDLSEQFGWMGMGEAFWDRSLSGKRTRSKAKS